MKTIITIATAGLLAFAAAPAMAKGSHAVKGHVTQKGSYVAPHRATNPDSTKRNNWSQKGNANPYTGKQGTKKD